MLMGSLEKPAVLDASVIDRDQLLVKSFLAGDERAFDELAVKYHTYIYNICLQMLGNAADAEDATQNALISAYRALPHFKMKSRVSTWLYRIAVNQCLSLQRSRRLEAPLEKDFGEWSQPSLEDVEKRRIISKLLQRLAPHFRAVLILRYYRELSYIEIAEVLGWSPDKVKCYLHRARNVFKEIYLRECENGEVP